MSRNRLNLLLAALAMIVVAVAGFFLAVQPQLAQTAAAHEQTRSVEQANDSSRAELARLREQASQLPAMQRDLAALDASVPAGPALPSFIDELNGVAQATGMQVSSFTASDATAYTPPAATTGDGTSGESGSAAGGATATATPAPTASAAPTAPQVVTDPAITSDNFSVVPVTVAVDGTFDQALSFVQGVQSGSRLFLITTIASSQKTGDDGSVGTTATWTFGGSVYVLDRTSGTGATAAPTADANR
jgi:Tfp pilus assembly protein PilO